jgi:hypothetical protein
MRVVFARIQVHVFSNPITPVAHDTKNPPRSGAHIQRNPPRCSPKEYGVTLTVLPWLPDVLRP